MKTVVKKFQYGAHEVVLESGAIARQADGAVLVNMADTVVLVAVVCRRESAEQRDFLPLTVNYQERTYAAGKIPGGFFRREGRPSEKEILICRLIDRPMRPLFPPGFTQEVQVVATVMSLNPEVDADVPALLGASAAMAISGVPFNGPIGAARIGFRDEHYLLNPTLPQLAASDLDLVVAGTEDAVLMVESQARRLTEAQMLGAVDFGHRQMQTAIAAIREFAGEVGKQPWAWQPPARDEALAEEIKRRFSDGIGAAYRVHDKQERQVQLEQLRSEAVAELTVDDEHDHDDHDEDARKKSQALGIFSKLEKEIVRSRILQGERRIDGRDTRTVRPIHVSANQLPRAHGDALFTRGETQAAVVVTLGTDRDAQILDNIEGESRDRFMMHYNFPPYCVGETGFMGSPKRREIGHGRLAKRGLLAVMPSKEEFPYVLRVVAEITESNGSSSMASVCGASLALMGAGVPIKAPVAGIAMGLIIEGDKFAVLTDIMGDEDHFGDMDFKVAGTADGVTALQMDIKVGGVTPEIMAVALERAREGRLHILDKMNEVLAAPREMSRYAPRLLTMRIKPAKIREVIGKGGSTIRSITEETGATVDIDDDGVVTIASADRDAAAKARKRIEDIIADVEVGKIYDGTVARIVDFGAFVTILPGRDGLVHISQISEQRIESVSDELSEGDRIKVKVLDVDRQGRVRLSMRGLDG